MEARGTASTMHGWTVGGNSIGGLLTLMVAEARGAEAVKGCVLFNCAGGLTSFREEELPWVLRPLWIFVRVVLFGDIFGPGLFQRFRTEENVRSVLAQVGTRGGAVSFPYGDMVARRISVGGACGSMARAGQDNWSCDGNRRPFGGGRVYFSRFVPSVGTRPVQPSTPPQLHSPPA